MSWSYILCIHSSSGLEKKLNQIIVTSTSGQMQNSILQWNFCELDLSFSFVTQKFAANIQIACIHCGKQRNISILQ